jgi:hypothetical protein
MSHVVMREEAEHFVVQLRVCSGKSCVGQELLIKEVRVAAKRTGVGENGQCGQEALEVRREGEGEVGMMELRSSWLILRIQMFHSIRGVDTIKCRSIVQELQESSNLHNRATGSPAE